MDVRQNKDRLSQSPHFNTSLQRSPWTSTGNVPPKQTTDTSLTGKNVKPSEKVKSRVPRSPRSLSENRSQKSVMEPGQSARSTSITKSGGTICRNPRSTIPVVCLILALCAIPIVIAIIFVRKATNITTTSTTYTSTSSMLTTSTVSTSRTTTTTTTTTTIPPGTAWIPSNYYTACSSTCINVSTVTSSTLLASWTFDLHTKDVSGNGNDGQVINPASNVYPISFTTGYIGQAISLPSAAEQYVVAPYIDFVSRSFTVEAWIYLNSLTANDSGVFGEYQTLVPDQCIRLVIRNYTLYMGFFNDSFYGATPLTTYVWYHVAFVYDYSLNTKYIYLNGLLDGLQGEKSETSSTPKFFGSTMGVQGSTMGVHGSTMGVHGSTMGVHGSTMRVQGSTRTYDGSTGVRESSISPLNGLTSSPAPYSGTPGNITIGMTYDGYTGLWDGLLDQVTVTDRSKTSCEIFNDASLVVHFPFDSSYNDTGPNSMIGTYYPQSNNGLSWVSGRVNQALHFTSSNSYFQSCGFYALGRDQPYSIAMWVKPSYQSGTLFHLSASGAGSGHWCLPMIGFSLNGAIVVQTWNETTVSIMGPILPRNSWTHIVQTYSSTNGLRLYINGGLYGSATVNTFSSSNSTMCVLLASSGLGTSCAPGLISMGSYSGTIDELYVYNRELNATEVCPLAHP